MSRAKATDVSSPISLFPFIGVLLSTMGALLVVLIAVSRSAHDAALRDAEAQQVASAAGAVSSREKIAEISAYVDRLNGVRADAEKRLRDDQLQLSHVEDHTRRLKEQLQQLQNAAYELATLETNHYDDRKIAEREVERLEQLIASTREALASQQEENKSKKRSYAIIPYEGPHGTGRRPIYIECRKDEVLLQPEGIRLTAEDFRPPLGAGNPLAAALRTAREYIVRQEGAVAPNKQTEPYPLILVRPEGILAYYRVREAIESWDSAFGYELVEDDWTLEYPEANPLLAEMEAQAIAHSRSRQQMLVAAAPRAYGARHVGSSDSFDDDSLTEDELEGADEFSDETGGGFGSPGGGRIGNGHGGPHAGVAADASQDDAQGEFFGDGTSPGPGFQQPHSAGGSGAGIGPVQVDGSNPGDGRYASGGARGTASATGGSITGSGGAQGTGASGGMPPMSRQTGGPTSMSAGAPIGADSGSRGAPPPLAPGATGSSLADGVGEASLSAVDRSALGGSKPHLPNASGRSSGDGSGDPMPLDMQMNVQQRVPAGARGQNWAIRGKGPTSVPIRRTIHVAVHSDRLAIQTEAPHSTVAGAAGKEISLSGPMAIQLDEFVGAIQYRVHEWGLAGSGMYWRPVLLLDIGPDGQSRADELTRLLRNSGIEVRSDATAARPEQGGTRETR